MATIAYLEKPRSAMNFELKILMRMVMINYQFNLCGLMHTAYDMAQ